MILVKRTVLVLFGIGVVVALSCLGVYGYHAVIGIEAPGGTVVGSAKVAAEDVLFAAIVAGTLALVAVVAMIARSVHLSRELDKIVELSRYSDFSPEASLRKLGEIGGKLIAVYRHATAVSESKSVKISALSNLNDFLVSNLPIPVMIASVTGTVIEASRPLQQRVERNRNELVGVPFHEVIASPSWNDVETEVIRRRTPVSHETPFGEMTFYPIVNRGAEVAYVVCSLEKPERLHLVDRSASETSAGEGGRPSLIRGILSGMRRQLGGSR